MENTQHDSALLLRYFYYFIENHHTYLPTSAFTPRTFDEAAPAPRKKAPGSSMSFATVFRS